MGIFVPIYNMQMDDNITPLLNWLRSIEITFARAYRTAKPDINIYQGNAVLNYDPLGSGAIVTKIELTEEFPLHEMLRVVNGGKVGSVLSDDSYFQLELVDSNGNIWTDEATADIEHNITMYDGLGTATIGSKSLTTHMSAPYISNYTHQILIKNVLKADFPDFRLKDGTHVSIDPFNSFTRIILDSSKKIDAMIGGVLSEALSIVSGQQIQWIYDFHQHETELRITIWSINKPWTEKPLPNPIPKEDGQCLIDFVSSFVDQGKYLQDFTIYWHSIHNAWQASSSTASLPLSVSIEGLVNNFFSELRVEDNQAKEAALAAQTILDQLEVSKELKERLKGCVANVGKSSVKRALKVLEEQGFLTTSLVKSYGAIRNRAAHGVPAKLDSDEEVQLHVTQTFGCLSLFYRLLLIHLKYSGSIVDHSSIDFPTISVSFDRRSSNTMLQG